MNKNDTDLCIFNLSGKKHLIFTVYVDDLSVRTIDWLLTELTMRYNQLEITRGMNHNYLRMVFDLSEPRFILIPGMIEDIISSTKTSVKTATDTNSCNRSEVPPRTLAAPYLFDISTNSDLLPESQQVTLHSTVAKLRCTSTLTRQDLLTTISLLSERVLHPTQEDWKKLQRTLGYLESTKMQKLKLGMTTPMKVRTYIDAWLAVHSDFKSHTGICISLGVGCYYAKSTAQKINTTSSCQAKGFKQSIYSAYFLAGQGYKIPPIVANQDNQSTTKHISNPKSNSELTRHSLIGYY